MSCPNAANVNIKAFPEGACLPVEGCPDGEPVIVDGVVDASNYRIVTGAIAANGQAVEIDMSGEASVGVTLDYQGSTGQVQFQIKSGSFWLAVSLVNYFNESLISIQTDETNNDAQVWTAELSGVEAFRVIAVSAITGSVGVTLRASLAPSFTIPTVIPASVNFISAGSLPFNVMAVKREGQLFWVLPVCVVNEYDTANFGLLNKLATYSLTGTYDTVNQATEADRGIQIFQSVQANANGNTTIWTPAVGKSFRLMRYMVMVTADASTAGGAVVTISLNDNGAAIAQDHDVFCPAAAVVAGSPPLYVSPWVDLGNGVLSAAVNNVLNVNLSAALATGNVRVICCGTEE